MGEDTADEVATQLTLDEAGHGMISLARSCQEGFEVLAEGVVEKRLLRTVRDVGDNSRNNHFAAWLIFGEGFQNNHHRYATSAKFSYRKWEIDIGYGFCLLLEKLGVLQIRRDTLVPSPAAVAATPVVETQNA